MNRRQFVLGTAAAVSGGSVAIGSGAFSFVRADRDVEISVAEDASAYLGLRPSDGPNGRYATTDDGVLGIDMTGANPTDAGGMGVNPDARTVVLDVFEIVNQGTQTVTVYYESDDIGYEDDDPEPAAVELHVSEDPANSFDLEVLNPYLLAVNDGPDPRQAFNDQMSLEPGEHISVGFDVLSDLMDGGLEGSLTITARAEDSY